MTIESGALESAYAKVESAYGTLAAGTPDATDAIRHVELALNKKNNREPSPHKRATPDKARSLPRRKTANFSVTGFWEPSGTFGTAGYFAPMLKAAFGAQTTPDLQTTVEAAPSPTTTTATLADTTGLAVGDQMVFDVASGARREVTRILTLPGSDAVTFHALSAAPDAAGDAVSGVNFKLASLLTESLTIYLFHTGGGFKQAGTGSIVNRVEFTFDGTREVGIAMSGPCKDVTRSGITLPGDHTTVGEPASGMVGNFYLDAAAFLISQSTVVLENNEILRNIELGTDSATGHMRDGGGRNVTVSCQFYLEDVTLIATAEAVGQDVFRLLVGNTDGQMVAVVCPRVEWEIPDTPTTNGPKIVTANGVAYAVDGNDQITAGEH